MGKRDGEYELSGVIELDEGFFTSVKVEEGKDKPLKRGRGSQKKSKILIMVESVPVEGKTTKEGKQRKVGHIKMVVIDDLKANIASDAVSDNSTSYVKLKDVVMEHHPEIISKDKVNVMLPWVHLVISNAKRLLLDVYYDVEPKYLQSYLNEFCYKYNRR